MESIQDGRQNKGNLGDFKTYEFLKPNSLVAFLLTFKTLMDVILSPLKFKMAFRMAAVYGEQYLPC